MKHIKTYKIFESNINLGEIKDDIMYILQPLKDDEIYIQVFTHESNPAEYLVEIDILPDDCIDSDYSDEFRQLFSFLEEEGWSLIPSKYKSDPSYCEVDEDPNFVCPKCGSDDVDIDIDDDFTTRCDNCNYEDDRDEFRSYFYYFKNVNDLLKIISMETTQKIRIKFFKLK